MVIFQKQSESQTQFFYNMEDGPDTTDRKRKSKSKDETPRKKPTGKLNRILYKK